MIRSQEELKKSQAARDFRELRISVFGNYGGQLRCARFLKRGKSHVDVRTVRRWETGETPVPFWVKLLLKAEKERRGRP